MLRSAIVRTVHVYARRGQQALTTPLPAPNNDGLRRLRLLTRARPRLDRLLGLKASDVHDLGSIVTQSSSERNAEKTT